MSKIASLPVAPITSTERIVAIDVLRGFALLGILPVNMVAFAHVEAAYQNPAIIGDFPGLNYLSWLFTHLIFENKMVTIFSMLFGVGLFIQVDRAEQRRGKVGSALGLYFRRVGWLLLFGLVHAYLFWFGDVLTYYAIMGMLIYWVRRWKPRTQIILGIVLLVLGSLVLTGLGYFLELSRDYVKAHPEMVKEAEEFKKMEDGFNPPPAKVAEEAKKVREADFFGMVQLRAKQTLQFQVLGLLTFTLWRFSGLMLIGIALYKLGAFQLEWTQQRYRMWMLIGFVVGIPLTCYATSLRYGLTDFAVAVRIMGTWDYVGSLFMAAGYFALIMLMVKEQWYPRLQHLLGAVGQMALTNYLMHTLICTFIFHGWGLAQFGTWPLWKLSSLVLAIWILQLVVSPIWLRYFRFGPAEWVWRSLTYWKRQPMRVIQELLEQPG
jgi:uncharacterized protein